MKKCKKCQEEKELSEYYKNNTFKDNLTSSCKICCSKHNKKRYPEIKEQNKKSFIKWKYGISWEEYIKRYDNQEGKCAICKNFISIEVKGSNPAVVDHSHQTGKVRKLLCGSCNKLLGFSKDNILILEESINYLKDSV